MNNITKNIVPMTTKANLYRILRKLAPHSLSRPFCTDWRGQEVKRCAFVFVLAIFSLFFSMRYGSVRTADHTILMKIRLPRTLSAFSCGGLLALSGTLIQLLLQNPLADPYILGISGGAALFTLLMLYLGVTGIALMTGAWCGSLFAIFLIMMLARKHRFQTHSLLLSGIAIASGFSACISFILLISPDTTLHSMLFWLCGDLNDAQLPFLALTILILGSIVCFSLAPGFNILYRGEREARALGIACKKYRIAIYILSSLFTAAAVTLAGTIGFVGLIVPHLTRKLVGFDHRILLPASILIGGSLLTFADTFARTLFSPQQIPVGIILAMIGVPLFIWLLQK